MMRVPTPKSPKRSGRVSMATVMLFMGVVVLLILIQPAAAERPERSLLSILGDDEDGTEEIEDTAGEAQADGEHFRVARSLHGWWLSARCPCVRYCTRRSCSGWWWRRRCSETRYCCERDCDFIVH
ncbi:uncharacterized protein LOC118426601 [Branchiostoma floridae]|uniref:Uncharacterized protein LOC118426601 n=1 Tax=Branchiostoma floridae TaxID=7739 RepID=A0A9J7N564_BRAFL|nr:uncharacterized protein LOC118426601 [Branchiostoma floridae]